LSAETFKKSTRLLKLGGTVSLTHEEKQILHRAHFSLEQLFLRGLEFTLPSVTTNDSVKGAHVLLENEWNKWAH
jgi:hypothetical protein